MGCSGLSDAKFEAISEDPSDMIWFCHHCRLALPGMKSILKSISKIDKKHTALASKHDALEKRVKVLELTKEDSITKVDERLLTKKIQDEIYEAMEKKQKKKAVIF